MTASREPQEDLLEFRTSLRQNALHAREERSPEVRHRWSAEIAGRFRTYIAEKEYSYIHCYLNFRSEVETRDLIGGMLSAGIRVVVPVVERIDSVEAVTAHEHLAHTEILATSELIPGRFGIEEPVLKSRASLEQLDAVVVPIVAFDRHGTRLGYGKGFYDVFLRELPRTVERIGLAFSTQEITYIPALSHDEPLDLIVTEQEIIKTLP